MARPTKYTPEIIEKARKYLSDYSKDDIGHVMPSVVGLAVYLNISKSTVYDWAGQEDNEFSDIVSQCNDMQELVLMNKGLTGETNASITKLILGKHGYSDKQATELTGADGTSLIPESITVKYE